MLSVQPRGHLSVWISPRTQPVDEMGIAFPAVRQTMQQHNWQSRSRSSGVKGQSHSHQPTRQFSARQRRRARPYRSL